MHEILAILKNEKTKPSKLTDVLAFAIPLLRFISILPHLFLAEISVGLPYFTASNMSF